MANSLRDSQYSHQHVVAKVQSINQSMHMRVLSPMWEVALIQQEFLENNVFMITQFIIYNVKQNY